MRTRLCAAGLFSLLALGWLSAGGLAQLRTSPFPSRARGEGLPSFRIPSDRPSLSPRILRESFEQTQKDTAELYALATELKAEMEEATEDVLSITVLKKAEEIEKLAEKIKNRMKNL
jgi:hypothetical protein